MDRQISIYHSEVDVHEVSPILEGQLNDLPPISSRIVRVFISSTFSDTLEERNALMENVYPKLKDFCRDQHGLEFQAIDLRWGIRDESQDDHTTIDLCLQEIENCQKSTIGPSFVTFIGQKYGYRPFPPIINASEFETMRTALQHDGKEVSLLDMWFKKDDNVLPPVYNLVPVSSNLVHYSDKEQSPLKEADQQLWQTTFQDILQLLRDGVLLSIKEGKLNVREKEKYFVSVTEYEIEKGLLQLKNPSKQCLCFSRTITNLEEHLDSPLAPKFIDIEPGTQTIARQAQNLLRRLKVMKIPHAVQDSENMGSFQIRWEDPERCKPNEDKEYLKQFCDMFYEKMKYMIELSVTEVSHAINDQYVVEILQHLNLCKTRQEVFRGRQDIIKRIRHYMLSRDGQRPMVVYGESGSGKTSLLAKAAGLVHSWFPKKRPVLLVRFLGTTARSSSLRLVLGSVCWQIGSIYGQDMKHLPLDCPGLVTYFHELLNLATDDQPLMIFFDSLDQLSSAYQAHTLTWLPKSLPAHVHLVVSTLPKYCEILDTLRDIVTNQRNFVEVLPLGLQMGQAVLSDWLKINRRTLTSYQQGVVQKALIKCSLPLYTRLIFEEVCRWKSYTPPLQTQLQDCVTGILNVLFERVERYYGEKFVCHALSYLTASKNGLSDAELDDLLSLDDEVLNDVFIYWLPPVRRIPPLLWPRLHNELSSYITQREANATIVLYWYHRQFIEVARQRYLSDVPHRIYIHSVLVHYYLGTWGGGRKKPFRYSSIQVQQLGLPMAESEADRKVPMQPLQFACEGQKKVRYNLRKLSELPFHLVNCRRVADLKREVLFNYNWLHAKITSMSLHDVLADFRFAVQNDMKDKETCLLENTLRLCGSHVNRNPDTLAFDLLGRLLPYYDDHRNIRVLLQQCDTESLRHSAIVPVFQCFEATKGMLRYILEDHKRTVRDLTFSKSTGELISVSLDGTIGFWDLTSGERTRTIDISDLKLGNHTKLLQSGDGRYLVCDSGEKQSPVCIFNMKTNQLAHKMGKRSPNIRRVFSVGNLLCWQKSIINISTGKVACTLNTFTKSKKYVTCGITPNEKYILVGEEKQTHMFELRSGRLQTSFPAENLPCMFTITPDSRLAYAGYTEDCLFKVFDLDPKSETFGTAIVDFDAQKEFPEVLNSDGPRFGKELGELAISPHNPYHVALNVKRCHLVVYNIDLLRAKLMDTKAVLRGRLTSNKVYLFGTTFNYDGSYLLAGMDRHLYIWDVDSGQVQKTISLHNTHVFPFAVSHEKNLVVTGSQGNTAIKVWDFDNSTECAGAAQLRIYENPVDMMKGSPVDQCVYIKQYYGLVNANAYHYLDSFGIDVWNMNTGNCLTYLPFGQYGTLEQMSISPNGEKMALLLGVRSERFMTLIDLVENKLIVSLSHFGCHSFVMSPCWDFAVTIGLSNEEVEMKLWNLKSEAEIECFTNCSSPVFVANNHNLVYIENGSLIVVYSLRMFVKLHTMYCIADQLQLIPNRPDVIMATMFPNKDVGDETPYSEVKIISIERCKIVSRINYVSPRGIVDVSKDGLIAIDSYLQAFDLEKGIIINDLAATVMGPSREYDLVRLTYDGKFAIWVNDLSVEVRSISDGKLVANVCTHEKPTSLELLDFGYLIVVGREDGHVLTMKLLHNRSHVYINAAVPYDRDERTNMVLEKSACPDEVIETFDPIYQLTTKKRHDSDFAQVSSDIQVSLNKQAKVPISITKTWSETDLKAAAASMGHITPKRRLSSPMLFLHNVTTKSRDNSPKSSPVESPMDSPKMRVRVKEKTVTHEPASALGAIHKTGNMLMACVEAGSSLSLSRSPSPRIFPAVDMEQLHRHLQRTMDVSKMS